MGCFFEIRVNFKTSDTVLYYDHVDRAFVKTPDLSTAFFSEESAQRHLDDAKEVWGDGAGVMSIVSVDLEEQCDE